MTRDVHFNITYSGLNNPIHGARTQVFPSPQLATENCIKDALTSLSGVELTYGGLYPGRMLFSPHKDPPCSESVVLFICSRADWLGWESGYPLLEHSYKAHRLDLLRKALLFRRRLFILQSGQNIGSEFLDTLTSITGGTWCHSATGTSLRQAACELALAINERKPHEWATHLNISDWKHLWPTQSEPIETTEQPPVGYLFHCLASHQMMTVCRGLKPCLTINFYLLRALGVSSLVIDNLNQLGWFGVDEESAVVSFLALHARREHMLGTAIGRLLNRRFLALNISTDVQQEIDRLMASGNL